MGDRVIKRGEMLTTQFFRKGSQVIATIDIVTSVLSFVSILFFIFLLITHGDHLEEMVQKSEDEHPELEALFALGRGPFIMVLLAVMIVYIFYFFVARYLLHATYERSQPKVRRWYSTSLVLIIIRAAFFITAAVFFTADQAFVSFFGVVGFLYQIFCILWVRAYLEKLNADNETKIKYFEDLNSVEIQKNFNSNETQIPSGTFVFPLRDSNQL